MPRGVKREPTWVPVVPAVEPYPEHAKLYPNSEANWSIREFMDFLAKKGLTDLGFGDVNDLILEFRGVDKLEYEAESADMRSKYRWLYDQYKVVEPKAKVQLERAVTKTAMRVAQAALPEKGPDDGLTFLLERIRGGKADGLGDQG